MPGDYPFSPLELQRDALHQHVTTALREQTGQLERAREQQRQSQLAADATAAGLDAVRQVERTRLSEGGATAAELAANGEWGARTRGQLLAERERAELASSAVRRSEREVAKACAAVQNSGEGMRALGLHRAAWQGAQNQVAERVEEEAALEFRPRGARQ